MALNPSNIQSILVETPQSLADDRAKITNDAGAALAGYVTTRINQWEDVRNRGYQSLWGEFWRMWRGKWNERDKNRLSERSRIVAPALAQAIEATVAEIEEAIFSRDNWFDVANELKESITAQLVKDQLLKDLDTVNIRDQIIEAVLNGAIFGTLIAKINVYTGPDQSVDRDPATAKLKANSTNRVWVAVEAIRPDEFIPDPVGKNIEQMHGCAHRMQRSMHYVLEKINSGVYNKSALPYLGSQRRIKNSDIDMEDPQSINTAYESEQLDIIEYHGKVPLNLMEGIADIRTALDDVLDGKRAPTSLADATQLVETIITVANGSVILRAMINPFVLHDRSFIACQFDRVPNRFWGRGVAEKGYNPQKALDAELRARIDALGYISSPMMGVDSGRMPRSFKYEVKPGKIWPTQGNPSEILQPFPPLNMNTLTFEQTQEMERMVQMGTGSFDTSTALRSQSQSGASSLSSNSMMMGAFVKRAKLSIQNIDRNFLTPIVEKIHNRYRQFDPLNYPDAIALEVKPTMGIVAREVEASQMTQLIGMLPDEYHQAKLVIAQGIIDNTSFPNKAAVLQAMQQALQPSPAQQKQQQLQEQMQQLQIQELQANIAKTQAETQKVGTQSEEIHAQSMAAGHDAAIKAIQAHNDSFRVRLQQMEAQQMARQNDIAQQNVPINRLKAEAAMVSARKKTSSPAG